MKETCHHQTLTGIPKRTPKKTNTTPCTICYTSKTTDSPKGETVETTYIHPGKILHMELACYNVTTIYGFTSIITVVCAKARLLWILPTASNKAPIRTIRFILTALNNEQRPWKRMRVDEDRSQENQHMLLTLLLMSLSYPCKLLVDIHHVSMGRMKVTTILYTTWLDKPYLT